eukprot:m.11567 g.11567  ORF g.11567 m.11567 type:complete len:193 (-) comp4477_c0_seq1:1502-2080(-)
MWKFLFFTAIALRLTYAEDDVTAITIVPDEEAKDLTNDNCEGEDLAKPPGPNDKLQLGPNFETGAEVEEFVATEEWQVVKPGQQIPPGLHVTIDMQTGEKKAKLLSEQIGIKTISEKRNEKLALLNEAISKVNDVNVPENRTTAEILKEFANRLAESKVSTIIYYLCAVSRLLYSGKRIDNKGRYGIYGFFC